MNSFLINTELYANSAEGRALMKKSKSIIGKQKIFIVLNQNMNFEASMFVRYVFCSVSGFFWSPVRTTGKSRTESFFPLDLKYLILGTTLVFHKYGSR